MAGEERILDLSEENPKQLDAEKVRVLVDRLVWRANDDPLASRIADSIEAAFNEGAGRTIIGLCWHLPTGIIDRRFSPKLAEAPEGVIVTVLCDAADKYLSEHFWEDTE